MSFPLFTIDGYQRELPDDVGHDLQSSAQAAPRHSHQDRLEQDSQLQDRQRDAECLDRAWFQLSSSLNAEPVKKKTTCCSLTRGRPPTPTPHPWKKWKQERKKPPNKSKNFGLVKGFSYWRRAGHELRRSLDLNYWQIRCHYCIYVNSSDPSIQNSLKGCTV